MVTAMACFKPLLLCTRIFRRSQAGNAHTSNWLRVEDIINTENHRRLIALKLLPAESGQVQFKMELAIPLQSGIQRVIWGTWKFGSYLNHSFSLEDKFNLGQLDMVNTVVEMARQTLRLVWGAQEWTMFMAGYGVMASDCGLMGGYPASSGYRFQANKTNMKERIDKRLPIPTGGDLDPDHPTYEENMEAEVVYRDRQAVSTQEEF